MKDCNISFVEAGLLERVRYFSEYSDNGSGWCYVGKLRLADEFGMSKQGLIKAINRLIERNLLIKNDKGWLQVNLKGATKFTGQQSLPVNKVTDRGQQSLPNNILKEDNSNIDIIIDSNSKLLLGQQSLPVNKVDGQQSLPQEPKKKKKAKVTMTDDEYGRMMISKGFRCYGRFENVFMNQKQLDEAVLEHGSLVVKETIDFLSAYKEKSDEGMQLYKKDYAVMCTWAFTRTKEDLTKRGINYKDAHARELGLNKSQ